MEQKSYTKKELRVLMEATGYPMASIEKTMACWNYSGPSTRMLFFPKT